ncbi:ABC transporter permease [Paraburkholderia silviterrae]|uniref:ABC transporter permease n=1 Tax=Paraburkholderia silviterrae TaxID=2528715 RepID=A0A4R5MGU7_9BURK|nr:ABC transporter permease [Paraburkholderia silviterrae]TDG26545.1 ABC transporter permease [Paraburkholderia silviterrae]
MRGVASGIAWRLPGVDNVGCLVAALVVLGLTAWPFVTFRANRIVAGHGLRLGDVFTGWQAGVLYAIGTASAGFAMLRLRPGWRFGVGVLLLGALAVLLGYVPGQCVGADTPLARVAPAGGAWTLAFAYAVLVTDAAAKGSIGPLGRLGALVFALAALAALCHYGWWDGLSVMQEYAARADSFWQEAARHVALVAGAVGLALVVGLPLGIACAQAAALRATILPALNIVQTIPSIALYGLLMVPLGLLAAHVPLAASLGIRGIGTAPALAALFVYSLLPVVSSIVAGLRQIPAQVAEAAAAMGMTRVQRLVQVELPLALPVILTGVRIVLVQDVGLAAVAALIGGGGFGTFIFQGIGQSATDLVLLGAIPTIVLAFLGAAAFDAVAALARRDRA